MTVPSAEDAALLDWRRRKDEHFASGQGPLRPEALADFRGLSYYPPDPAWRFRLELEPPPAGAPAEFEFETSSGQPRFMALAGQLTLPLPEGARPLLVFADLGDEAPARLFLPFRDATSGRETYGAGRYIEAPVTRGEDGVWVDVDFNRAYHPSCLFSDGWSCPVPPAANTLAGAVRAGERLPEERGEG